METYLDLGGNAQATATRLNLHRSSLYYRLDRIAELPGGRPVQRPGPPRTAPRAQAPPGRAAHATQVLSPAAGRRGTARGVGPGSR
ncbi:helix-turn-helix domain-containing protein [Pseudonocardia acaciae]|uniref:helix-turn-helix domain-containing protein n=1 Tax=Pseudonocardia acaciae TaxID=551276 RepID=UPI001FE22E30|nr:helix-turn-helix domain-containing protein [Pseudonocardia acaciae]